VVTTHPRWRENSFTREERLLKKKDFLSVRKKGIRLLTRSFIVFALKDDHGLKRLGLAVSAKVGPSVRRNRIKRLLREFFRLNKNIFPESTDIFISVKTKATIGKFDDVEKELFPVLERLRKKSGKG